MRGRSSNQTYSLAAGEPDGDFFRVWCADVSTCRASGTKTPADGTKVSVTISAIDHGTNCSGLIVVAEFLRSQLALGQNKWIGRLSALGGAKQDHPPIGRYPQFLGG